VYSGVNRELRFMNVAIDEAVKYLCVVIAFLFSVGLIIVVS